MFLAAVLLAMQQPATTATPRPDLTYGFATASYGIPLHVQPESRDSIGKEKSSAQAKSSTGLALLCGPGEVVQFELERVWLDDRLELFIGASAVLPNGCRLQIDARTLSSRKGQEPGAWTRALELGERPAWGHDRRETVEPGRPTLEVSAGHLRMLERDDYLQLRLTIGNTGSTPSSVTIQRLCYAGFDRSRVSEHEWGAGPGCGLEILAWNEREPELRQRSRQPRPLEFFSAPDSESASLASTTSAACLAMLLPHRDGENTAPNVVLRMHDARGFVEPGCWLSVAEEAGAKGTLRCFSIWPEVEFALGGSGPFAIRVSDKDGSFAWAVLSSFDDEWNALVYDPSSKEPQPLHWTRAELEKRWLAAGGLAFACRR